MKTDHVRKVISQSSRPYLRLLQLRDQVDPGEFRNLLQWGLGAKRQGAHLLAEMTSACFPPRIDKLWATLPQPNLKLEAQVRWQEALFYIYRSRLSQQIVEALGYESSLLTDPAFDALGAIKSFTSRYGHSIWALESSIHATQVLSGLKAQKSLAESLQKQLNALPAFLVFTASHRNEPTTHPEGYRISLQAATSSLKSQSLARWIEFRAFGEFAETADVIDQLMLEESGNSLFDQYETFIQLATSGLQSDSPRLQNAFASTIERMNTFLPDPRLQRLLFLLPSEKVGSAPSSRAGTSTEDFPGASPITIAIGLGLLRASESPRSQTPFTAAFHSRLEGLYKASPGTADALLALQKEMLSLRHLRSFHSIVYLHQIETSIRGSKELRQFAGHAFVQDVDGNPFATSDLSYAASSFILKHQPVPPGFGEDLKERSGLSSESQAHADNESELLRIEGLLRRSEWLTSIEALDAFDCAISKRLARVARLLRWSALVMVNDSSQLLRDVVSFAMLDGDAQASFPWEYLHECIDACRESNKELIELSIFYQLRSTHRDVPRSRLIAFSCEDFLWTLGLRKPSELRRSHQLSVIDRDQLIYFLRFVCTLDSLRVSTEFSSSTEVVDERLLILEWLLELDQESGEAYRSEIEQLIRRQAVQKAVRVVEQSKISLDEDGLRKWTEKNLGEALERFKALKSAGLAGEVDFQSLLHQMAVGKSADALAIPDNEAAQILSQAVAKLFREATKNPELGLDCYLSMRVRHGALSGQLRSPLAEFGILSEKSKSGEYGRSERWTTEYESISPKVAEGIDDRLRQFSRQFDQLVSNLSDEYIQVRGEAKPNGLFDVVLRHGYIQLLNSQISPSTSIADFFNAAIEMYKVALDHTLEDVRRYIDVTFRSQVEDIFRSLSDDLVVIAGDVSIRELQTAVISARTRVQLALRGLLDWFKLPRSSEEQQLSYPLVLEISRLCVERVYPSFRPNITSDLPDSVGPIGMMSLVDILIILLDNIRKHSGAGNSPIVSVKIAEGAGAIDLIVSGPLGPMVDRSALQDRIAILREKMAATADPAAVSREGGSGFLKIRKILGRLGKLHFEISNNTFVTHVRIATARIS